MQTARWPKMVFKLLPHTSEATSLSPHASTSHRAVDDDDYLSERRRRDNERRPSAALPGDSPSDSQRRNICKRSDLLPTHSSLNLLKNKITTTLITDTVPSP